MPYKFFVSAGDRENDVFLVETPRIPFSGLHRVQGEYCKSADAAEATELYEVKSAERLQW